MTPVAAARSVSPDVVCNGPSPLCWGGGCNTYTVTVHVYTTAGVSDGSVLMPGIGDVGDGWSGPFNDCTNYNIAADRIASGYGFWYWYGPNVYIDNPSASSTFFIPLTNGVLMLILKQTPASSSWAGYVESTSTGLTSVTGTFTIPTSTSTSYAGNGTPLESYPCNLPQGAYAYDRVGYWVGIGGVNGNGYYMWQAGVALYVRSSQYSPSYYLFAWYETYYEVNGNPPPAADPQYLCGDTMSAGHSIKIQLLYGAGTSSGSITDVTTQASWPLPSQSFTPDTSTAEWVVESAPWAAPNTGPVHFTGCSSSAYGDLQAPVEGVFTQDGYGHPLSPQTITGATAFNVVYG